MRTVLTFVAILALLFGLLGFHWVSIRTNAGRKLCVVTKENLTFDSTFVSADSELLLALQHPVIVSRMLGGKAECGTL